MRNIVKLLKKEEWLTPNTYDTNFAKPDLKPGIYIFVYRMLVYKKVIMKPLYVGCSTKLKQRLAAHPIRSKCDEYIRTMKKPPEDELVFVDVIYFFKYCENYKEMEAKTIKKLQPKFNIALKYNG